MADDAPTLTDVSCRRGTVRLPVFKDSKKTEYLEFRNKFAGHRDRAVLNHTTGIAGKSGHEGFLIM
jgi:hypothetical protein